jgi:hypothetical protein
VCHGHFVRGRLPGRQRFRGVIGEYGEQFLRIITIHFNLWINLSRSSLYWTGGGSAEAGVGAYQIIAQTRVPGALKDGSPNCATVKPFGGWTIRLASIHFEYFFLPLFAILRVDFAERTLMILPDVLDHNLNIVFCGTAAGDAIIQVADL